LIAGDRDELNSGDPPMPRATLSLLVLGLVAGCAAAAEKENAKLSLACQMSRCECAHDVMALFDTQPVQWKPDGSASCPEGYHLRRLSPAVSNPT
jgi:hypothetical protein